MSAKQLTRTVQFDKAPAYPDGLLAVQAGVEASFALGLASIILSYVKQRSQDLVDGEPSGDEHFMHALLVDMAQSLYSAAGAEA